MKTGAGIFFFILLLFGYCPLLYGQQDLLDEFSAFTRQQLQTYDRTVRQMNKEFALYLKQAWQPFETHSLEPLQKDPDVPTRKPSVPASVITKAPTEKSTQQRSAISLAKTQPVSPNVTLKEIDYFGTRLSFPFCPDYRIGVKSASENDISRAWSQAADVDFSLLLQTLQNYKHQLNLNDWGFLLLVRQVAESIYGEPQRLASTFFTAYCLNQLSHAIRLGRVNGKLTLLAEIQETVYDIPQINCDGSIYTILSPDGIDNSSRIATYTRSFPKATQRLSLAFPQLPLLSEKIQSGYLPNRWQDTLMQVEVNQNLIDFYATLPQTEFTVYANAGLSPQVQALANRLRLFLQGKETNEAAALLLDFVQNAFEYQSDRQQFKREKVFFPDEMLYYPYNDCEDRAILYARLVQHLLGLKVILVNYPNHIAAAVCLPSASEGATQYQLGKERYTLCDPTYLGAGIGECMPQFVGKKAKLIQLSTHIY